MKAGILVPRAHDPFGLRQGSRPLAGTRKSANHGLPAFVRSLRNLNNNGYYRLQKWAAIALARYVAPARGLDPWRRPKGSWALGTRMESGLKPRA